MADTTMTALELIAAERERQKTVEGWTEEHDDQHDDEQLASAAAAYALPAFRREGRMGERAGYGQLMWRFLWPWDTRWWKPTPDDRVRELVKAGALIVAEIERRQRAESARG